MPPKRHRSYRKFGILALLSLAGSEALAQAMPALRVDPALLGQPALPATESAAPTTPAAPAAVAPAAGAPAASPAAATSPPVTPAKVAEPNDASKTPATRVSPMPARRAAATTPDAGALSPVSEVKSSVSATSPDGQSLPPTPRRPRPVGTGAPTTSSAPLAFVSETPVAQKLPPLRVDPALLQGASAPAPVAAAPTGPAVIAVNAPTRHCRTVPIPRVDGDSGAATNRLPALRVDPALLGQAAATSAVPAQTTTVCDDEPTQIATAASAMPAARRAGAVPLSQLPKELARPALGNPDETTIVADSLSGREGSEWVAEGNVELTKNDAMLQADRLIFRQAQDEVEAIGNVRLARDNEEMIGSYLRMQVKAKTGYFDEPAYVIQRSVLGGSKKPKSPAPLSSFDLPEPKRTAPATGRGEAARLHFEGEGKYRFEDATFSTCTPNAGGSLDWYTEVADLKLDYNEGRGVGKNTTVYFKDVPILYTPYIDFPLDNERKSGLLAPSIGTSTNGGLEFTQPIYWNIAPNMDATISPRLMTKRGIQLRNEFRYLEPDYVGQIRAEYMPKDRQTGDARHAYTLNHQQNFGNGLTGTLALAGVSDDLYFKDLENRIGANSKSLLLNQGVLSYSAGWWSASLVAQDYQVLQDPRETPVDEPYARMPQLNIHAVRADLPAGLQFNFNGEAVRFDHSSKVTGTRTTLYPQISLPLQSAAFYLTPKVGYHNTAYSIDRLGASDAFSVNRGLPIASVDGGAVLERPATWFGRDVTQTLEPRLYYLYVPAKDQSRIPVFDTGIADFNFAQIFAENRYVGGDRIGDANQLTGMVSSRFIEPESGAELMRFGFGQRFYFTDQEVNLTEPLRTERKTDLLAAFSGQILPRTWLDTAWQYNQFLSRTERFNIGMRYQPEIGKLLNASYRFAEPTVGIPSGLKQVDISGQWPLGRGWYGVGRYNYSLQDKRLIESIAGLEYDGGCWIARGVLQRTSTVANDANTSFFVQLELKDFSRIGSNPLNLLKRSVSGYREINTLDTDPDFAVQ